MLPPPDCCIVMLQENVHKQKSKTNLHPTRAITPKRVTSGAVHRGNLAPTQHNFEEISQQPQHCGRFNRPGS